MMRAVRALVFTLLVPFSLPAKELPAAKALADFFRPYQTDMAALSPDGVHVAYDYRQGNDFDLVIYNRITGKYVRMKIGDVADAELSARKTAPPTITFLKWATSERVILAVNGRAIWSVKADGTGGRILARETREDNNVATDSSTSPSATPGAETDDADASATDDGTDLTAGEPAPPDESFAFGDQTGLGTAYWYRTPYVENMLPGDARHILIGYRDRDRSALWQLNEIPVMRSPSMQPPATPGLSGDDDFAAAVRELDRRHTVPVHRYEIDSVDIETGRAKVVFDDPRNVSRWMSDPEGKIRAGLKHFRADRDVIFLKAGAWRWQPLDKIVNRADLARFAFDGAGYLDRRSVFLGFDYNPDVFYFASNVSKETFQVFSFNTKTNTASAPLATSETIDLADPLAAVDGGELIVDEAKKAVVGIRLANGNHLSVWFDPYFKSVQKGIDGLLPKRVNQILEWDAAAKTFLVRSSDSRDPGTFYLVDFEKNKCVDFAQSTPWLSRDQLAETVGFEYTARDGARRRGFLTFPADAKVLPMPTLALLHDGPWRQDEADYNPHVQSLAALGYAVIQVNFRSSIGFGYRFANAVRGNFCQPALDDVEDALRWAIQSKLADPKKLGVIGFGYGGYLSLMAMADGPVALRCAVAVAAPVDPRQMINRESSLFNQRFLETMVGSGDDAGISPLRQAGKINGAVFMVYGGADTVTPRAFGSEMTAALRRRHVTSELYTVNGESHTAWLAESSGEAYEAIGRFLNVNMNEFHVRIGPLDVIENDVKSTPPAAGQPGK